MTMAGTGDPGLLQASPTALRRLAAGIAEEAAELAAAARLPRGAACPPGAATGPAADRLARAWSGELHRRAGELAELAGRIRRLADDLDGADRELAGRIAGGVR
ncbi:hypothetical protein CSPHI_11325 [Corynebacterium sphenisci DSM 44792]|uniref:Uncharacterized protein n=1 Tax=Corynebacterium sphenisci DSM 44792 TaxID=1437874 RepID=A0A1L7D053_9CORY|nr:hypothetical protein [Corynebacterium sphenisci]APT91464.1 hypothetical protein CSPHI_11325 [Corynebacterium sphenisci DSM 44792]